MNILKSLNFVLIISLFLGSGVYSQKDDLKGNSKDKNYPVIYNNKTTPLEYIEIEGFSEDYNIDNLTEEERQELDAILNSDDIIHGVSSWGESEEASDGSISPMWSTPSHGTITKQASIILKNDKGSTAYNKLNEYLNSTSGNGLSVVEYYSKATDSIEQYQYFNGLPRPYLSHFYDASTGESYVKDSSTINAYTYFNNHYYLAVLNYKQGNKVEGYKQLGMAIHYLEDLNNPYHASNKTVASSNHSEYETWVNNNIGSYFISNSNTDSYNYIKNSTFIGMSNNFASLAKQSYNPCSQFIKYPLDAYAFTHVNLSRTQRATAGLMYRFLIDTNRV